MGGSSGSGASPTQSTISQVSLPEYAEPYFHRIMQRGEAESLQPYSPYQGQRLAYWSPDELNAQAMTRGYAGAGTPAEYGQAAHRASQVGAPMTSGYTAPTDYASQYTAGRMGGGGGRRFWPMGQQGQRGDPTAPEYGQPEPPPYREGQGASSAEAIPNWMQPRRGRGGYRAPGKEFFGGYDPNQRASGYRPQEMGAGYSPLPYDLDPYMNPYQQGVIDLEKKQAIKESEKMRGAAEERAIQAGGLGGYREAILQAQREKNLASQLGSIQTRGSQASFAQAQQQLERERGARLAGAEFGLQRYGVGEGTRQRQEEFQQQAYTTGEQARLEAAKMGMSAAEQENAARQAQEKFRQSRYGLTQEARQAQEKLRQSGWGMGEGARQAQEELKQRAYDVSGKYGIASADALRGIGGARQQDVQARIAAMSTQGERSRAMRQAGMDIGYQDFMRQQRYPSERIGGLSALLRGVPAGRDEQISTYEQQPGLFQSALSMGLGGLGLYRGLR